MHCKYLRNKENKWNSKNATCGDNDDDVMWGWVSEKDVINTYLLTFLITITYFTTLLLFNTGNNYFLCPPLMRLRRVEPAWSCHIHCHPTYHHHTTTIRIRLILISTGLAIKSYRVHCIHPIMTLQQSIKETNVCVCNNNTFPCSTKVCRCGSGLEDNLMK